MQAVITAGTRFSGEVGSVSGSVGGVSGSVSGMDEDIDALRDKVSDNVSEEEAQKTLNDLKDQLGELASGAQNAWEGIKDKYGDDAQEVVSNVKEQTDLLAERFNIAPGIIPVVLIALAVVLFRRPIRWFLKVLINSVCGLLLLVLLNQFGYMIGVSLDLDMLNVAISGVFGVPGVAVLFVVQWLSLL